MMFTQLAFMKDLIVMQVLKAPGAAEALRAWRQLSARGHHVQSGPSS